MYKINLFLVAIIWGIFYSPSIASDIEIKTFKDYYEVTEGEYVDICWEFTNADYVQIKGLGIDEQKMKLKECFGFVPDENTALKIFVISGEDTMKLTSVVVVHNTKNDVLYDNEGKIEYEPHRYYEIETIAEEENKQEKEHKVSDIEEEKVKEKNPEIDENSEIEIKKIPQRGPIKFQKKKLDVSFEVSDYYSGAFKASKLTAPKKIKITSSKVNYSEKEIELNAIVLDEFGNFLQGLNEIEDNHWNLTFQNNNYNKIFEEINVEEVKGNKPDNIGILLDNSIAQFNREYLLSYVNEFLYYQDEFDNVSFSIFNQYFENVFDLSPMDKTLWEFENLQIDESNGLNSLYKSLFIQLDQINKHNPINPYLIVLTYNSDNSSLIYTADDVINLSNKYGIPIYIIGIGNAIDTYSLRYISLATGGNFYHIMDDEFPDILKALLEISNSRENHYKINVNLDEYEFSKSLISKLNLITANNSVSDYTKIIFEPKLSFIPYQILANFDSQSFDIDDKYYEVLDALVFVLKNNPEKKIQLIGHSDREGNESENIELSKARAIAVKDYLVQNGIKEENISIKGEGFHKPLFYNTFKEWQKRYNRRVEVKWLDPTVKPYEVVLQDLFDNEYKASKIIDRIDKSGFNSYYERYIFGNEIYYQIRLWGFSSIPEAKTAAYKLQRTYKYKVFVE